MGDWTAAGRALPVALLTLLIGTCADPAFADLTVFAGGATTPPRATFGAALGLSLQPVGLEFEYGDTPADPLTENPALRTGLFNLVLGAALRRGGRIRVYGAVGAGAYRERLAERSRTDLAVSAGAGIHFHLAGPFGIRLDYRLFALRGNPVDRRPRRVYAGLGMAF